jgi:hypothetical protein
VIGAAKLFSCSELERVPAGSPDGSTYDAVVALDEETAQLDVPSTDPVNPLPLRYIPLLDMSSEPVIIALPLNGNPAPPPAFNAYEEVLDHDAVPKKEPL